MSCQDNNLRTSGYNTEIDDKDDASGVTAVSFVEEYHWIMGEYSTEQQFCQNQWRMRVVSIADTEFSFLQPFRNSANATLRASSIYISYYTNSAGYNALSGRDIQVYHWQDDIWDW